MEMRSAPCAASSPMPTARSTWLGSSECELHAEPPDTPKPRMSKRRMSVSLSSASTSTCTMLGRYSVLPGATSTVGCTPGVAASAAYSLSRSAARRCVSAGWLACAASTAAAKPAAPATFCVPERLPASCPPPSRYASKGVRAFTYSAPMPFGPPTLCAENDAASQPQACTSTGVLPSACVASVWNSAPTAWADFASSATGWMDPSSELAVMTLTSTVLASSTAASASGVMKPARFGATRVTRKPCCSKRLAGASTASCSMAETTTCGVKSPAPARRRAATAALARPNSAALSASVAPLVKISSSGRCAPSARAMRRRASSSAANAARPGTCRLFALPP